MSFCGHTLVSSHTGNLHLTPALAKEKCRAHDVEHAYSQCLHAEATDKRIVFAIRSPLAVETTALETTRMIPTREPVSAY